MTSDLVLYRFELPEKSGFRKLPDIVVYCERPPPLTTTVLLRNWAAFQ